MSLVGLRDSKHALFDPRGLWLGDLDSLRARLDTSAAGDQNLIAELELLRRLPAPALVDCTADGNLDAAYLEAFARGIHVVAANKKPLTQGAGPPRRAALATADRQHRYYHYETTVGAGLPVIGTLKDLVRTGDHVRLIEGSFSGTLGFLANEVSAGVPLSVAVQQARERAASRSRTRETTCKASTSRARRSSSPANWACNSSWKRSTWSPSCRASSCSDRATPKRSPRRPARA